MVSRAERKVGTQHYQELIALVAAVIRNWDPYSLLAGGAPKDEFDAEIASVTAQIPGIKSATDAANAISRVFSSNFEAERFSPEVCRAVGETLYLKLKDHGVVE